MRGDSAKPKPDSTTGSVTFHAERGFLGAATRVFAPRSWGECVNVACLEDQPVRSISWADIDDISISEATLEASITFFGRNNCGGTSKRFDVDPMNCPETMESFGPVASFRVAKGARGTTDSAAVLAVQGRDGSCHAVDVEAEARRAVDFPGVITVKDTFHGKDVNVVLTKSQLCVNIPPINLTATDGEILYSDVPTWSTLNDANHSWLALFAKDHCQGERSSVELPPVNRNSSTRNGSTKFGGGVVRSMMLEQYSPFPQVLPYPTTDGVDVAVPRFNGTVVISSDRRARVYYVDQVEACYNVGCTGGQAANMSWSELPLHGRMFKDSVAMAIYSALDCTQTPVVVDVSKLTHMPPQKPVQSFMIWVNHNKSSLPSIDDDCLGRTADSSSPPAAKGDAKGSDSSMPWLVVILAAVVVCVGLALTVRRRRTVNVNTRNDNEMEPTVSSVVDDLQYIAVAAKNIKMEAVVAHTKDAVVHNGTFHHQPVMVKQLRSQLTSESEAVEQFAREAHLGSKVTHPKIVQFHGVYWDDCNQIGIVYERMDGGDLASLFRTHGSAMVWADPKGAKQQRLPIKLRIAIDIAEALVFLHSYDPPIAKPQLRAENVLLTRRGVAKLWNLQALDVSTPNASTRSWSDSFANAASNPLATSSTRWQQEDIHAFGGFLMDLDVSGLRDPESVQVKFSPMCPPAVVDLAIRCLAPVGALRPSARQIFFELQQCVKVAHSGNNCGIAEV